MDVVRRRIWSDQRIPFWYRQNILLFVRRDRLSALRITADLVDSVPPEVYLLYLRKLLNPGIRQSAIGLFRALKRRVLRVGE